MGQDAPEGAVSPAEALSAAADAAKLLLSLAGSHEEARRLLDDAAVERGRARADALEAELYDPVTGLPR